MICATIRMGEGPYGLPVMKFTLTYDGELKSNANTAEKWRVRNHLSPQLEELWAVSPILRQLTANRYVGHAREIITDVHHTISDKFPNPAGSGIVGRIDLLTETQLAGRGFMPLIRASLALRCGLKITFLRKEEPGHVRNSQGDLDNRIKTLLDGLSSPLHPEQIPNTEKSGPMVYTLLEDDSLISGLAIETGRLLTRPQCSRNEVRLIIDVDVRVAEAHAYNQLFLGD
jgi:hypothetical protein